MIRHIVLVDKGPDVEAEERFHLQVRGGDVAHFDAYTANAFAKELAATGKHVAIYMEIARVHPGEPTKEDPR